MAKKGKKKAQNKNDHGTFEVGEFVGAKVKGHPLWPGRIESVDVNNNKTKYVVRFYGTDETASSFQTIKLFKNLTAQDKTCSKKGFDRALMICQEEYDAHCAIQKIPIVEPTIQLQSDGDLSPSDALSAHSEPVVPSEISALSEDVSMPSAAPSPEINKICKLEPQQEGGIEETRLHTETRSIQTNDIHKIATKLDTRVDNKDNHKKLPKIQGENLIIAKLQEKVNKKLAEKDAQKIKHKESKILTKASTRLVTINDILLQFLSILDGILKVNRNNKFNSQQWDSHVKKYNEAIRALGEGLKREEVLTKDSKISEHLETCRETLANLDTSLISAQANDNLSQNIKEQLNECLQHMKKFDRIGKFVEKSADRFGNIENAMIERKENNSIK